MGRTNEAVFPDPVLAIPTTSRPSIIGGIAFLWMGVGFLYPFLEIAFNRVFPKPKRKPHHKGNVPMFLNEDPFSLALKAVSLSNMSGPLSAVAFLSCLPEVFLRFAGGTSVKENGSVVVSLASRRALEISTASSSLSDIVMS
jgi:hypothetical protein